MTPITRRDFVKSTALAAAAAQMPALLRAQPAAGATARAASGPATLTWLEGHAPAAFAGTTWGVSWPRGAHAAGTPFALATADGTAVPVQTWTTATWPDGSLKWTAHAIGADAPLAASYVLTPGAAPAAPRSPVRVTERPEHVEVDTGVIVATVPRDGGHLLRSLHRDGRLIARAGHLVALVDDQPSENETGTRRTRRFASEIESVVVEQSGPVRAVLKLSGRHRSLSGGLPVGADAAAGLSLPFTVRLYFHAGGEAVRIMHSFVFDGDENKDFIRGLGVRFAVPLTDELHNRHVRFVGAEGGLFAEAVRGLTGLRRDPGREVKEAQLAGLATPATDTFPDNVRTRLGYIPAWGDYTLHQGAANAFTLRKRTKPGHGWIDIDQGKRAAGTGYVGGATGGGVVFGLRDFWQRHPTQLDVRGAHTDTAEVTLWLWSPEAPAMDLRFYHDGMGMETHPEEIEGLEITYEDYQKGWGSAHGIARSSELFLWAVPATPARERTVELAAHVSTPPLLAAPPEHVLATGVFGGLWSLPDRSTPAKAALEDRLDWSFAFHRGQVEQRHWFGFWNYGDVMHTYDRDRHVWRYDVGGFAWDNSELSPDLWLWLSYLRTGRADIFRFAEAMTRHTGEVDVYHTGRFAGLGTRHNVQHWGCSAKQVRISTPAYRRIYYYLTADERTGDLMRELLDVDTKFELVDPVRKLPDQPPKEGHAARISFGTDWSNLAVSWLTEWERGGPGAERARAKLLRGMRDYGAAPLGFFTSERFGYDAATGGLTPLSRAPGDIRVSHLDAVFGAVETFAELIALMAGDPACAGFERAWLQYCTLYNGTAEEQQAALGARLRGTGLQQAHARLTAYAAKRKNDSALARRAWDELSRDWGRPTLSTTRVEGPLVLNPVDEAAWVSTNDASQFGLAAIEVLALVRDAAPAA